MMMLYEKPAQFSVLLECRMQVSVSQEMQGWFCFISGSISGLFCRSVLRMIVHYQSKSSATGKLVNKIVTDNLSYAIEIWPDTVSDHSSS